ncbi:hypothetical protein N9B45_00505 [bacterium]|nr:hypothetical protein [bacterium]MDA7905328.1 hypothetical protein [Mariniblastus sp.]MDA7924394.1 hypothetical protein [Mariniblastus sp.]MDC0293947.1 hypothetical protein [Mariniblastus sp.]
MDQLFVSKVAELKYWIDDAKTTPQKWIPVLLEIEALRQQTFGDSNPAIILELSACNSGGAIALRHPMTGVERHFVNFRSDTTDELCEFKRELKRVVEAWTLKAELKMEPPQPPKEKKWTINDKMFRQAGECVKIRGQSAGEWSKMLNCAKSTIHQAKAWGDFAQARQQNELNANVYKTKQKTKG